MILTVTAHAALDRVIMIPTFQPEGRIIASSSTDYVGGKGFDVSVALSGLGVDNLAMGILAGENGRRLEFLLHGYGVEHDLTWVSGETRIAHVIVEADLHRHTHIMTPSYQVAVEDVQRFLSHFRSRVWEADWVVASGSLAEGIPVNFYAELLEIAHQAGVRTLIDCFGEPARQCLAARPDILKQNTHEFVSTFQLDEQIATNLPELLDAITAVQTRFDLPVVVITRGKSGILAVTPKGTFQAYCQPVNAVSAAGAGDTVSATLSWRLGLGDSWQETLRWSAAAGAAGALTAGTGEVHLEDVLRLLPQVVIERISEPDSG